MVNVLKYSLPSLSFFARAPTFLPSFEKKFPPFYFLVGDDDAYALFPFSFFSHTPRSRRGKKRIRVCSSLRPPTNPPKIIGYWNVAAVERASRQRGTEVGSGLLIGGRWLERAVACPQPQPPRLR